MSIEFCIWNGVRCHTAVDRIIRLFVYSRPIDLLPGKPDQTRQMPPARSLSHPVPFLAYRVTSCRALSEPFAA